MADDLGSSHVRTDFGELSDAELVRATRRGSRRAYAALWKRHSVSALKYAKTLSPSDADDVVSEAFLKVYAAIKAGRGPEEDFRYYIRSAVRNTYVSMVRASRSAPAGDAIDDVVGDRGADLASVRTFDDSATVRAFLSLPARWQEVLWYTEVEGLSRERTAAVLGMNANAVSALSFRAREALRTAWLQEHVSTRSDLDRGCEAITPLLGAYSRRGLSRRDRLRVEHHVHACAHCTSVVAELSELLTPGRLALVLLPVALAGGGFAAWASKVGGGSAVVASASTIATPTATATVVAAVGGTTASGAAALTVVGKVAACALVATLIVPPTQLLIEASHDAVLQTEPASAHAEHSAGQASSPGETVSVKGEDAGHAAPIATAKEAGAAPDDPGADGRSRADAAWRGNDSHVSGATADDVERGAPADSGQGDGQDGGRPSSVGIPTAVSAERANQSASPRTSEARTTSSGKASSCSPRAEEAADQKQPSAGTAPVRANATGARTASAAGGATPTEGAEASSRKHENASPNAAAGSARAGRDDAQSASGSAQEAPPAQASERGAAAAAADRGAEPGATAGANANGSDAAAETVRPSGSTANGDASVAPDPAAVSPAGETPAAATAGLIAAAGTPAG